MLAAQFLTMDLAQFVASTENERLSIEEIQQLASWVQQLDPSSDQTTADEVMARMEQLEHLELQRTQLATTELNAAKSEYETALKNVEQGLKNLVVVRNSSAAQADASTAAQASLRKQCSQLAGQIDAAMEEKITALQLCKELESEDANQQAEWDRGQELVSAACARAMQHVGCLRARAADLSCCIKETQPLPALLSLPDQSI